ncbi:SMI1/KNR4 family protein [Thalassobius sp. MITS945101]|uniref:SMI1/KNR4 family protein n=1 Tax=Thalassobius sp. MITS945101 TaxID=3096994 RepID=UPI00399C41F5
MSLPLDEKFVVQAEQKLGARLPADYRAAMCGRNGGTVFHLNEEWRLHPIADTSDRKRLKRTFNDVVLETKAMAKWTGWPEHAVAIASNGAGDALVFLRSGRSCETAVYLWNHETGALTLLVQSFAELFSGSRSVVPNSGR